MAQDATGGGRGQDYRGGAGTRRWGWQQSTVGEAGAEFLGPSS